mmetsp:Transcript_540/g.610  ORF Transcript_540/g.610 Transcript_540/m.610 type:complete len:81 (-) Transcript_540:53-295(-)
MTNDGGLSLELTSVMYNPVREYSCPSLRITDSTVITSTGIGKALDGEIAESVMGLEENTSPGTCTTGGPLTGIMLRRIEA